MKPKMVLVSLHVQQLSDNINLWRGLLPVTAKPRIYFGFFPLLLWFLNSTNEIIYIKIIWSVNMSMQKKLCNELLFSGFFPANSRFAMCQMMTMITVNAPIEMQKINAFIRLFALWFFFIVLRSLHRSSSSSICCKACVWWAWHRTLCSQRSWTKSVSICLVWRILGGFQHYSVWSTKKNDYDESFFRYCQVKTLLPTAKSSRYVYMAFSCNEITSIAYTYLYVTFIFHLIKF